MGDKTTPNHFLSISDRMGGFLPPRDGFIPLSGGVVSSPQEGGFIPAKGRVFPPNEVVLSAHWVIGYHPFEVILSPLLGDFIPPLGREGGGVVTLLTWHYSTGRQIALGLYVVP